MIAITSKQATELSEKLIEFNGGPDDAFLPKEIERAFSRLCLALNEGLTLNSGDGFYYGLRRKFGVLYAHDGSALRGSLCVQLQTVWQRHRFLEVIRELCQQTCDEPSFLEDDDFDPVRNRDSVRDCLSSMGYCLDDYRRVP